MLFYLQKSPPCKSYLFCSQLSSWNCNCSFSVCWSWQSHLLSSVSLVKVTVGWSWIYEEYIFCLYIRIFIFMVVNLLELCIEFLCWFVNLLSFLASILRSFSKRKTHIIIAAKCGECAENWLSKPVIVLQWRDMIYFNPGSLEFSGLCLLTSMWMHFVWYWIHPV